VKVTVNRREVELDGAGTVSALLEHLGLPSESTLVERNGEPVERVRYAVERLEPGDSIVVARAVAGG
jgi:thiamine biosynthesis protein ThiS